MKVLILAAGEQRSESDGNDYPLCLTEFEGVMLLEHLVQKCAGLPATEWIFAMSEADIRKHHLDNVVKQLQPQARILVVHNGTQGAACTALLAAGSIDNDEPLLIISANELVDVDLTTLTESFRLRQLDAGAIVFPSVHPRYSYARLDAHGFVLETAEKNPISRHAMTGIYWFAHGRDFVRAAMQSIRKDAHVEDRFYVAPTLNEVVLSQGVVGVHGIEAKHYHPLKNLHQLRTFKPALAFEGMA